MTRTHLVLSSLALLSALVIITALQIRAGWYAATTWREGSSAPTLVIVAALAHMGFAGCQQLYVLQVWRIVRRAYQGRGRKVTLERGGHRLVLISMVATTYALAAGPGMLTAGYPRSQAGIVMSGGVIIAVALGIVGQALREALRTGQHRNYAWTVRVIVVAFIVALGSTGFGLSLYLVMALINADLPRMGLGIALGVTGLTAIGAVLLLMVTLWHLVTASRKRYSRDQTFASPSYDEVAQAFQIAAKACLTVVGLCVILLGLAQGAGELEVTLLVILAAAGAGAVTLASLFWAAHHIAKKEPHMHEVAVS